MKRIAIILAIVTLTITTWAQSPQKMSYQAVIRNSNNQLIVNHPVGMRISILSGSVTGVAVYAETQKQTTNDNGLITLEIGEGTVLSGDFLNIDWAEGPYFIKTETDPSGGDVYTITGTSQLLSVPYALYATKAGNGFSGNYNDLSNKPIIDGSETLITAGKNVTITGDGTKKSPYVVNVSENSSEHIVGEIFEGGIVFYSYDKGKHGLIASLNDLSLGASWGGYGTDITNCESGHDGFANSAAILAQGSGGSNAAALCASYNGGGKRDWYLPSLWELNLLHNEVLQISYVLSKDNDNSTEGFDFTAIYWSSTEENCNYAWTQSFGSGRQASRTKDNTLKVRAIRRF